MPTPRALCFDFESGEAGIQGSPDGRWEMAMNRCLIFSSMTLFLFCLGTPRASAEDGNLMASNGSIEALQSAMEQFQRDPFDEQARKQINELLPGKLPAEEIESLESRLESDPHDLAARTRLIQYYMPRIFEESARRSHHQHLLWLIHNAPDADVLTHPAARIEPFLDPAGYVAGKQAWQRHIEREPSNVKFLGSAARFLSQRQDRELIIEYLEAAQSLDPDNPDWPQALGGLYLRSRVFGGPSEPMRALEHFRLAYDLADNDDQRGYLLGNIVQAAFEAESYDDVRTYAATMLDTSATTYFSVQNFHEANIVLGRVALAEDDVELAKYHLLEAGRLPEPSLPFSPGPMQLEGPNMRLASEMLQRGEREAVLEYFDLCSRFWHSDKLNDWAAVVKAGGTPDFRFHPMAYRP